MPAGNVVEAPFASNRRKIFVFRRSIYIIQSIELLDVFIIRHAVGYVLPDWVSCVFWLSFLGKFIALIWLHVILPNVKVYAPRKFFFQKMDPDRPRDPMLFKNNPNSWLTEFINFTGLYCLQACMK